jgi:hypothetical protein
MTTSGVQKGLVAHHRGEPVVQEGLGFGLPIVRLPSETLFSRTASLAERPDGAVVKRYGFDRAARIRIGDRNVEGAWLRRGFESLVALYMRAQPLQPPLLRLQEALARSLGGSVTYIDVPSRGSAEVEYALTGTSLRVRARFDLRGARAPKPKYVMANEQGADHFGRAVVDGRALAGRAITGWLKADDAAFHADGLGLAFSVRRPVGASMFVGRECNEYLRWSGINLESASPSFDYVVELGGAGRG